MQRLFKICLCLFLLISPCLNSYAAEDIYYYQHYLQQNPRPFERYTHVDSNSLLGCYTGLRGAGGSDTALWPDLSSNSLDFTMVSAPTINGDGSRTFDGTNDYGYQEVLDDETGTSFIYASNTTSYGFLYTDLDFANLLNKKIILTDGSGNKAWAYTDSVGAGLTVSNKWTSDFSAGVDGCTASGESDLSGNIDGVAGVDDTLRFTCDALNSIHYIRKESILTANTLNRIRENYYISGANSNLTDLRLFDGSSYITATGDLDTVGSWDSLDKYWTAVGTRAQNNAQASGAATFQDVGGDDVFYLKDIIIDQVIDIPAAQGCHVVTTYGGATKGWNTQSGFDFNDISSFQVVEPLQISTALSIFMVLKPDDGQPASNNTLLSKWQGDDGLRGFRFYIYTTGLFVCEFSSDGNSNSESEQTDSAIYSDGAQSAYSTIAVVYNGTTVVIYFNGSAVASTTGVGGIPASLWDSPELLTIGALSNASSKFNGDIQSWPIFTRALTADEVKRLDRAYRK